MTDVIRFKSYKDFKGLNISKPSFQREIMPEQIGRMKEHILKMYHQNNEPMFGVIFLADLNDNLFIVDGQHRLTSIKEIYEEKKLDIPFDCKIYKINTSNQLKEFFQIVNKNIAIPEFILSCQETDKTSLLREIQQLISERKGFSLTAKNRPQISLINFINTLSESKLMEIIKTKNDFCKVLEFMNNKNRELIKDQLYCKKHKITQNMLNKWFEYQNYICIESGFSWLEGEIDFELKKHILGDNMIIDDFKEENKGNNIIDNQEKEESLDSLNQDSKRKKFNKSERQQIWDKYIGLNIGQVQCPYCHTNMLNQFNFEIGHVISLKNSGSNDIDNLRCICKLCNGSMGANNMDLNKYKVQWQM